MACTLQPNGEKVRRLRMEKAWTQEELATKVGCAKRTIEKVESGRCVLPRTVREIAQALGVPFKDLVNGQAIKEEAPALLPSRAKDDLRHEHLFRIDAELPSSQSTQLLVDLGFFRARLKGADFEEPTDPVFCGCGSAWIFLRFSGLHSCEDPRFLDLPENAEGKISWGIGTNPSVRFQALNRPFIMEGRGRLNFSVTRTKNSPPQVEVTLDPAWLSLEMPTGFELDSARKIIANALLRKLLRPFTKQFPTRGRHELDSEDVKAFHSILEGYRNDILRTVGRLGIEPDDLAAEVVRYVTVPRLCQ
jgi:transcriptional regulator with XRE-family HTH domain